MAESLEEFLNIKNDKDYKKVTGSMECQECSVIVNDGYLYDDGSTIQYTCSQGHTSEIRI
jgi:hypothetical protein